MENKDHESAAVLEGPSAADWNVAMDRIEDFFSMEGTMEKLNSQLRMPTLDSVSAIPGELPKNRCGSDDSKAVFAGPSAKLDMLNRGDTKPPSRGIPDQVDVAGEVDRQPAATVGEEATAAADATPGRRFRLGIPRSASSIDGSHAEGATRYLHIPQADRRQFQQYAKALATRMSVECADSNPYIQALNAHRAELLQGVVDLQDEVVDSLPSRLATQRSDALATLKAEKGERAANFGGSVLPMTCGDGECADRMSQDTCVVIAESEEWKASSRNRVKTFKVLSPPVKSDRRPCDGFSEEGPPVSTRVAVGSKHFDLSEDDRSDFLNGLLEPSPERGEVDGLPFTNDEEPTLAQREATRDL
eukprot:gnl/TRDRNA2_/TRDRNA2_83314_c0_seq1.p1 gnl/TRDRNA2_/TRDRNA2_83314_c0~~gnl/TRDRNA2_/TRDRNA2_83314_c0_seq1.p1  ORF type:complete len:360 (-),score=66.57 gnl/TRDRNA2_/TRDRNA2_83314_c0_seq1:35-1114(-)